MRDFCAAEGIRFVSATPALTELARGGEIGYLVTDTHWQAVGQSALVEPILRELDSLGVLD